MGRCHVHGNGQLTEILTLLYKQIEVLEIGKTNAKVRRKEKKFNYFLTKLSIPPPDIVIQIKILYICMGHKADGTCQNCWG